MDDGEETVQGAARGSRRLSIARGAALAAAAIVAACSSPPASPPTTPRSSRFHFVDVAARAGLTRVLHAGRPGKDHLLDSAGAGAAWIDFDRDGLVDIYLVNGWLLDDDHVVERGRNALYRNRGDGTFEDVTDDAGVGGEGRWGSGVAAADYDGDGWTDLLVTNFGPNLLYRNLGDGTFVDVAARAGIEAPGWNTGASFLDADGDGDLDVYVAAYVDQDLDEVLAARRTLSWKGVDRVAVGPFGLPGDADRFFRANGDGTFTEATRDAGLTDKALGFGFATRALDVDADGDLDLYVANDSDANYLYRNEGDGTFRDIGMWSGAAFDAGGAAQAGMGVAAGDVNGDGHVDLFVTNFSEDFSTLYLGDGAGFFADATAEAGIGQATRIPLSWGTVLADLDSDGDLDLAIANGHIYPQVDEHPEFGMTYAQRNQLLENTGDGRFVEATGRAGPGFEVLASSRGLAAGDYDNDGDLDLLFTNLDRPPTLLRNDSRTGHWLGVELAAGGPLIGARVAVRAGGRSWTRDLASGDSFLCTHDPRLLFGLGAASRVDRVEVRWADGRTTVLTDVAVDRYHTIGRP